jgi:hypothetical protein
MHPVRTESTFKKRLKNKSAQEQGAILKAITHLRNDPSYPGLRTHKIRSAPGVIGARFGKGGRLTFRWEGNTIVLLNHCSHQEVLGR